MKSKSKPILIDVHGHVNFREFEKNGHQVIKRALEQGIWLINVGAQYSTSRRALEYAEEYNEGVYAAVGLHPSHVLTGKKRKQDNREFEEFDFKKYQELLKSPKVVAVGEIGLDYGGKPVEEAKEKQKQVLIEQIELAQQNNKPIIFHCRKAYNELIELLTMFNLGCAHCPHACTPAPLRGVIHCFMGRWSQAEKFLEMGFYLSFNGLITYSRDYDQVIRKTPLDRLLLETDCPYLTPVPHRGKRNLPLYLKYVAKKIAEIKEVSFDKLAEETTKNTRGLFNI